ncbi:hypothetical protein EDB92DRAFT_1370822 [Lactarius akahatsu]|uniref:Extracellular membrane protein CFEM domain-containing protein n=1 Tax=Lactarius akahatsu TaxID=416441 RepID=A0AAD4L9F3_9AGAM|nr:hypothetical protein EDB92DRAFT_1370822 [Lactarius akahatsu]
MRSVFFLAVIAAPLIALADPEGSPFAELVRRLPDPNFLARSSIDPSSVSKECQSTCTPIIKTLGACDSVASCECTQGNYDALGTCLNCLQALASQFFLISPAQEYGDCEVRSPSRHFGPTDVATHVVFYDACSEFGFALNDIVLTATPTGIASTGDPFSIFGVQTATEAVTIQADPLGLLPTQTTESTAKTGGAVGLRTPRNLQASAVVAVAAVATFMGGLPL